MRKISVFLGMALMSLIPFGMKAQDCPFTPDMYPGQAADRTELEVNATAKVGDFGLAIHLKSNVSQLMSNNNSVVLTYNLSGYDAVLVVGAGTADVTYVETTFSGEEGGGADGGVIGGDDGGTTGTICSTSHTIHYTVSKGTPEAYFEDGRQPITEYHAVQGGGFSNPAAIVKIKAVKTTNGIPSFEERYIDRSLMTFTSSDETVATIGRGNQVVLAGGLGKTTITAVWAGDDNWEGVTISYDLYVEEPKTTVYVTFSPVMTYTDTIGNTLKVMPTIIPNGEGITISRWTSSKPEVASVDEHTGEVTMLSVGTTRIMAIYDGNDQFYPAQGYYDLTVVKPDPKLAFSTSDVYMEWGEDFVQPTLINPKNVTTTQPYGKYYCNWNSEVAEVNEETGEVNIKGIGEETIYFEFTGNETYAASLISYTIHVTSLGVYVKGVTVLRKNCSDVLGDGKVSFDPQTRTLTLKNLTIDAAEMEANIKNAVILDAQGPALYLNIVGNCSITNADRSIVAMQNAILITSQDKKGVLTLTATQRAIECNSLKIHECAVNADGGTTGILLDFELGISRGSHLLATSTYGPAIQLTSFVKGENEEEGYGIDILTPGVHFHTFGEKYAGFFTDENNKEVAKTVEIGKKPIVVPDDEETTIEFSQTDPDGNESVVFSTSVNDTYNETTGQLEIATSLTDEQVANALESVIPGSGEWVDLLPGSLVFDIPAGKGEMSIKCMTLPGYSLKVKMEGKDAVSVTQSSFGWAKVVYDVPAPVHVVIYLHATGSSSAPARIALSAQDETPTVGAYIEAVKITPSSVATAVDVLRAADEQQSGKVLLNGQLYIVRDGRVFTTTGTELK